MEYTIFFCTNWILENFHEFKNKFTFIEKYNPCLIFQLIHSLVFVIKFSSQWFSAIQKIEWSKNGESGHPYLQIIIYNRSHNTKSSMLGFFGFQYIIFYDKFLFWYSFIWMNICSFPICYKCPSFSFVIVERMNIFLLVH